MTVTTQKVKRWRVMYVGVFAKEYVEWFATEDEALAFCDKLDKRIKSGTCLGYDMTEV